MKDIESKEDIEFLVNAFYNEVKKDEKIGFFFTEIANIDFNKHLPKMYDFWESIIFKKASYSGNPMFSHIILNQKHTIEKQHFQRWLLLWEKTIRLYFKGSNAMEVIQRSRQIAELIQYKIR